MYQAKEVAPENEGSWPVILKESPGHNTLEILSELQAETLGFLGKPYLDALILQLSPDDDEGDARVPWKTLP